MLSICFLSFISLLMLSFIFLMLGIYFILNNLIYFIEWEFVMINSSSIVMTMILDYMSFMFMGFVLLISSMVIYYSQDYMMGDLNINRFIMLVLMFVLSMMMLIISPNLISILLGWDGLGLVSYCLVIYYQNIKSYSAGMLTVLSNRVGDVALLMSIAWMMNFGGWNYIFYLDYLFNSFEMFIISMFILLAAMTKSAQIPFSSWLPAAMAAPTPVSALVHSSTLVTAGVYLLIRFNKLFMNNNVGLFLLLVSCLTMFMSGLGANYEFDLKKIIALSTLSQLGLMMSTLALGYPMMSFFHLLTHALFKALLFMCSGSIIHNVKDFQDIRYMGGLVNQLPLTIICFNTANLALCGMPFLAGFYSKDLILELISLTYINMFIFFLFFISTGLTVCYSFRLVYYSMTGDFNFLSLNSLDDNLSFNMNLGMMMMMIMAVVGGSFMSWLIFPIPYMICLPLMLKILPIIVSLIGGVIGYYMNILALNKNINFGLYDLKLFLGSMWFMPIISTYYMSEIPLLLGNKILKSMDQGWSEYLGGQGLYLTMNKYTMINQWFQYNSLKIYLLIFVVWVILVGILFY
uniref:NADH dehydrogenase subunit 5 n=1 Tax=Megaxyela euchroma TaxID=1874363 RepID=UPI00220C01BB|nr:NADH dehydrogenase subunit 5 [Megaxyela euchroma]UXP85890.1 NADH dehydrogenase subunit 5 [Megaxyela euchroma]